MLIATFFFVFFSSLLFAQDSNRYTDSLFNYTQIVTNGVYATAPEVNNPYQGESQTHSQDLSFHLFAPSDDSLEFRPLIIAIHGGGFVSGNKDHDDMLEFCKLFASRGYVTATIQYRLGMSFVSNISGERAVYRGIQDGRAAIRYFKENADVYGIDTNNVYLIGSSAGAFVSLHNLYMNEESERPDGTYEISNFPPTANDGPDLGGLDAINPTLKHGSHPNGVISLWGAIKGTELIKESDGNIPIFLIHGTDDGTVPFDVGHPFGLPTVAETYGSKPINEKLISLGFNNDTYFVPGEDHEFYGASNGMWNPVPNAYWDTVVTKSTGFLWSQHKPEAKFYWENLNSSIQFKNESSETNKWFWNFGDGSTSTSENPFHEYVNDGTYSVKLSVLNSINSWDTTSARVEVVTTGIKKENTLPTKFELAQNYPNPFNPTTTIKYSIPVETSRNMSLQHITLKIYNMLGQEVATLVNDKQAPGRYEVQFDAINLSSGTYIYHLTAGNLLFSKKLLLVK